MTSSVDLMTTVTFSPFPRHPDPRENEDGCCCNLLLGSVHIPMMG